MTPSRNYLSLFALLALSLGVFACVVTGGCCTDDNVASTKPCASTIATTNPNRHNSSTYGNPTSANYR